MTVMYNINVKKHKCNIYKFFCQYDFTIYRKIKKFNIYIYKKEIC